MGGIVTVVDGTIMFVCSQEDDEFSTSLPIGDLDCVRLIADCVNNHTEDCICQSVEVKTDRALDEEALQRALVLSVTVRVLTSTKQ